MVAPETTPTSTSRSTRGDVVDDCVGRFSEALRALFVDDLVRVYFDPAQPYAAHTFHEGWEETPHRFTPTDLFAVGLMGVHIDGGAARVLIEDPSGDFHALLSVIDPELEIGVGMGLDPKTPGHGAARALWERLRHVKGLDEVRACQLLARKRPALIPVVDVVVRMILATPAKREWEVIDRAMRDPEIRARLEEIRPFSDIPLLRVADAAIWMLGAHRPAACDAREAVGLDRTPWLPTGN